MATRPENPLIVQSDASVLLDVHAPRAAEARAALAPFAELVKSPEHIHTYRVTPLSIWNACALGLAAPQMVWLRCKCSDEATAERLSRDREAGRYLAVRIDATRFRVDPSHRGALKQALTAAGFPAEDLAGYATGEPFSIALRESAAFVLRDYQRKAAEAFYQAGSERGGSGVVVLPCGAGKTIVGLAAMELVGQTALVLTTSLTAVQQWRRELLDKTTLRPSDIADYTGERKDTGPVTLTTYQILTWRADRGGDFPHLALFRARSWGLIVYDEVHLLPAPVFRATADLQARRRLGLTATLVREDGREAEVFALIGPQFRIAAENPAKMARLRELLARHSKGRILIMGEYLTQVEAIAREIGAPLITGKTPQQQRELIYGSFRRNELHCLVLSKVGNFAVDLPDADVLIQVSGAFGSRQEEAQRLGRILRPKDDGRAAHFFTLVSRDTREEEFAHHRKLFLTEQGYSYQVVVARER